MSTPEETAKFAELLHATVEAINPHVPASASADLGGALVTADVVGSIAETNADDIVSASKALRCRYNSAIEIWRECVKDMRTLRMTSGSELAEMEKQLHRLDGWTDRVTKLTAAVNTLAAALANPALKDVLK